MKIVKHILCCITLVLVTCYSLVLIESFAGDMPPTETYITIYIKLPIAILAFILSDLWLHRTGMRIIGIVVLVSLCLFSLKDYKRGSNDAFAEEVELGKIAPENYFEDYWKLNSLLAGYLILGIGVSCYNKKKMNYE